MRLRCAKGIFGALVVVVLLVVGWVVLWKRDYVQLGGDEGMEMAKAVLFAKAPHWVDRCWTDQPWLYSMVISRIWELGGENWNAARALSALAALFWIWATLQIAPEGKGFLHGLFIALCLVTWPLFFLLSFSTMVELPTMTFATLAVAVLAHRRWSVWRGVVAGSLAGIACGIKLIAVLAFPAWILAVLVAKPETWPISNWREWKRGIREALPRIAIWTVAWGGVAGICLSLGPHTHQYLLSTHWKSTQYLWAHGTKWFRFRWDHIWPCWISLLAATVAIVWLARHRRLKEALVPGALWLVPLGVHVFITRPFWDYYMLHLAAGTAALGGWIMAELLRWVYQQWNRTVRWKVEAAWLLGACLVAGLLMIQVPSAWREVLRIWALPRRDSSQLIDALRNLRPKVRLGFAYNNAYLANVGILPIPELAVLPKKRFWSGSLTRHKVIEMVREKKPGVILLQEGEVRSEKEWKSLLDEFYTRVVTEYDLSLYVRKDLVQAREESLPDLLQRLGL